MKPILLLFTALILAGHPAVGAALQVDSIAIPVGDLERATRFYCDVLDFKLLRQSEGAGDDLEHLIGVFGARVRVARLRLGEETIELVEFLAPQGRPLPPDIDHTAIIVSDTAASLRYYRDLLGMHVAGSSENYGVENGHAAAIGAGRP